MIMQRQWCKKVTKKIVSTVVFMIVLTAAILVGCSKGEPAELSEEYSSISVDTATASEDTVSSEDIGASEDTISSETVISDDSISAADMPEEDTRVHETPEELRWTIFTDTASEDMGIDEYVSMVEDMQIHYFDFNVGKEGKAEHTGCLEDLLKAAGLYKDDLKATMTTLWLILRKPFGTRTSMCHLEIKAGGKVNSILQIL